MNYLKRLIEILKKNIIFLPLIFIFFLVVVSAGRCILMVSSREPLANIKIVINVNGENNGYFNPIAKLARAHNNIGFNLINTSTWAISGVFVERLALTIDPSQTSKINDVLVTIGDKDFRYTQKELLEQWDKVAPSTFGYIDSGINNIILASPPTLSLEKSKIPVKKDFFNSIINWRGDLFVTHNVFFPSILPSLVFSFWLIILYSIYLNDFKTKLLLEVAADEQKKRSDLVVFYLTLILTIIFELILVYLIELTYHPAIISLDELKKIYLDSVVISFIPKPIEQRQFLLGVFFCPIFLMINYFISQKLVNSSFKNKNNLIEFFLILSTVLGLPSFIYLALSMSDFLYIKSSLIYSVLGFAIYSFVIFPAFIYLIIKQKFYYWLEKIFALELLLVVGCIGILGVLSLNGIVDPGHFSPVYFPQTQLAYSKVIIQQVPSLYGMFPLFLKPIFSVIGISVVNFTVVMSILTAVSFLSLFIFLKKSIKDKLVPILVILSILVYSHLCLGFIFNSYSPYIQYTPIRILFPALILFIVTKYLEKFSRYWYIIGHALATVALFWNFDSGMVVFISWNLFLIYLEIWKRADKKLTDVLKSICKHILSGFGSLLLGLSLISFYYIYNYGSLPDPNLFFQYSKLFYSGFFLIPLPIFPHMWYLVILVYTISLLRSFSYLINNNKNKKGSLYFILSIIGFGLFAYFEGRSHNYTLFAPSFVAFLILALFLDDFLLEFRNYLKEGKQIRIFTFFITIAISFILILPTVDIIKNINFFIKNTSEAYHSLYSPIAPYLSKNINFIKKYTSAGERVLILSRSYDGIYYGETNTVDVIDLPSFVDLVFKYQYNILLDFVSNAPHAKIFVNPDYNNSEILGILNSRFKKVVGDADTVLFIK